MPKVKRVIKSFDGKETVDEFVLTHLKSRVQGPGVTSKVLYDLRKRGKARVEYLEGTSVEFEVVR